LGTELGPEVALVSKVEGGGDAIVGLLESDDLESADVIHAVEFCRGASSEGSTSNADFAHFLNDMDKSVLNLRGGGLISKPVRYGSRSSVISHLDRSQRCAREFQCPLDLESV
jgi:hypothetical protein